MGEGIDEDKLLNTNVKDTIIYKNNNTIIINGDEDMNINVIYNGFDYVNESDTILYNVNNEGANIMFFPEENYYKNIDDFTLSIPLPDANVVINDVNLTNIKPKKLLSKYNINSNADLFKAIISSMKNEVSLFSSNDRIRYNILMNILLLYMPHSNFADVYTISGDLDGYIIKINKTKSNPDHYISYVCHNITDDYCYDIEFYNYNEIYFDYDRVIDILSSIEFN